MKLFQVLISSLPRGLELLLGLALFFLPISKGAAETLWVVAMAFWIIHKIVIKAALFPDGKAVVLYVLFASITLASLTQAAPFFYPAGMRGALKWLKYLWLFLMIWDIYRTPQQRLGLFLFFLASMLAVALDGFYQLYSGQDLFRGNDLDPGRIVRMKGPFSAPNLLATFLMFAVSLSGLFAFRTRNWLQILCGGATLFLGLAFFFTYSRGAFYALALSLVLNLALMKKLRLAALLTVFLAAIVMLVPSFRYNFIETVKSSDITLVERGKYWDVALGMIRKHPILGIGVNTYHARFQSYSTDPTVRQAYPHNSYIQMASEIGIPGALLFLLAAGYVLFRSLAPRFSDDPMVFSLRVPLLAFFMQSVFDNNFYALQTASLFWIMWGIFAGMILGPIFKPKDPLSDHPA